jgi:hypothetical protein
MGRWRTHNNRAKPRWIFDEQSETYVLHSRKHGLLWKDPRAELESKIYNEQLELIDTTYGSKADCNLGWAVTGDDEHIEVATKIYVEGRPVLCSTGYYKTGKIEHEWA